MFPIRRYANVANCACAIVHGDKDMLLISSLDLIRPKYENNKVLKN